MSAMPQGEWNYEPLRDALMQRKEELKSAGVVTHLSVYFQDLDHGPRFGIGEYEKFQPASLLKLPLAIFFLHAADIDRSMLDKKASYRGTLNIEDNIDITAQTIEPDKEYTIRELVTKMLLYSDNRSYALLLREMDKLPESMAFYTFKDLDVLQMMLESKTTYVSISTYARLFGVLYSTGYLSRDMSQFALDLLSKTTFDEGIAAGVPDDLTVAHKFGYAVVDGEGQLHDCGIVYHPKMSYTLCVMTSGNDANQTNAAIIEMSRMVYNGVSGLDLNRTQEIVDQAL